MDIRFIGSGEPGESPVCDVFGLSFALDEWVAVPDDASPAVVAKLSANPTFEVRGEGQDHTSEGTKARKTTPPKADDDKPTD